MGVLVNQRMDHGCTEESEEGSGRAEEAPQASQEGGSTRGRTEAPQAPSEVGATA